MLLWFAFRRNANLAGGFAGRRVSCFLSLFVFWLFPLFVDFCLYMATVLCTALDIFASTSVRTEPRATSAVPGEKKINHGKDKPVLRPGESHEGVGQKKKTISDRGH